MGMSTGNRRGGKKSSLAEINVTPLVDVMLVLLIVFMVTTPMIVKHEMGKVDLNVPETNNDTPVSPEEMQSVLKIEPSKRILLNMGSPEDATLLEACAEYPKCLDGFEERLKAMPSLEPFREGQRLFVMADRTLPYGYVLDVTARMKNAGIRNLGLVTNPPGAADERAKKKAAEKK